MFSSTAFVIFVAGLATAAPLARRQTAVAGAGGVLNEEAAKEANPVDDTAVKAFTATPITTSDGECLTVDALSGDFRQNLIPITTAACDGSEGQQWDIITSGKHNDQEGKINVVSSLTNGCLNFDPRRAAGNQVLLFSCGGRADGEGLVTDSQLFPFAGGATTTLAPANSADAVCLTAKDGKLDQAACSDADATQTFALGAGGDAPAPAEDAAAPADDAAAPAEDATPVEDAEGEVTIQTAPNPEPTPATPVDDAEGEVTIQTVPNPEPTAAPTPVDDAEGEVTIQTVPNPESTEAATPAAPAAGALPTVTLDDAAVAEAHVRDETATRAFSDGTVKTADGKCLQVQSGTGDFRENLVPITTAECDGSDGQKWDVITKGEHNDQAGAALLVSTLTQGCLNLDDRRQPGNQVLLFSCGGRADGEGLVTNSQLWKFDGAATLPLESVGNAGKCLVDNAGRLDVADCSGDASQEVTISA